METSEEQLRIFLQDIAKKEKYVSSKIDIKPITSGGSNFTADLFTATISEPFKENLHVFGKVANINENLRESTNFNAYEVEAVFYSKLAVSFENIYNKHNVPVTDRLVLPKYYGHDLTPRKEILILENVQHRGFQSFNRMKTFNWEYAATSVTQLAKFHAVGLSFRYQNPAEFETSVSKLTMDMVLYEDMLQKFVQMALETGLEYLDSDHKQRLLKYFSTMEIIKTVMTQIEEEKQVLVHGDFRPSNLMHRRRNGKLEVIVLDWQTLRTGNPVSDLLYFIFSGSDEEFRRLHYRNLVDHYYTELTLALEQLDIDVEKVYSRTTFNTDMRELLPWGLIVGLIMSLGATMDPEDTPAMGEDLADIKFNPNKLGLERVAGIVRDFVRWGVV